MEEDEQAYDAKCRTAYLSFNRLCLIYRTIYTPLFADNMAGFAYLFGPSFGPFYRVYRALFQGYSCSLIKSFKPIS